MNRSSPLHVLFALVLRGDRAKLAALVIGGVVERLAVVVAALGLVRAAPVATIGASAVAAIFLVTRRLVGAGALRNLRAGLASAVVRRLLASEASFDAPCEEDDTLSTAVAGLQDGPQFVAGLLPTLAADLIAAIAIIPFLALRLPLRALLVGAVGMSLAAASLAAALRLTSRWSSVAQRAFAFVYDDLAAAVGGRLEIVASGRSERFQREVTDHLAVWQRTQTTGSFRLALTTRIPFLAAAAVAVFAICIDATSRGLFVREALGQGLVVASTAPVFVGLLRGSFDWVRSIETMRPLIELLRPVAGTRVRRPASTSDAIAPQLPSRIEWDGVSFAYSSSARELRFVLRNLTGEWLPRTALAVRGPNGCGKSTFLRLLLGIGQPTSGRILVTGIDLPSLDISAWRRAVAYLPQRPFMPERATVREAVRFIAEDATDASIRDALVRVELWPALAADAPSDPLAIRVMTLSAGQRQRLALARVLCQKARVVLLDEPDANLDASGIRCVTSLVRELATDGMVLFAAHTRDLLEAADWIVDLGSSAEGTVGRPIKQATAPRP